MANKKITDEEQLEKLSLEETFVQLDMVLAKLEQDEVELETAFEYYKKGMDLLKQCNEKLDKVEKKVLLLDEDGELNEF